MLQNMALESLEHKILDHNNSRGFVSCFITLRGSTIQLCFGTLRTYSMTFCIVTVFVKRGLVYFSLV